MCVAGVPARGGAAQASSFCSDALAAAIDRPWLLARDPARNSGDDSPEWSACMQKYHIESAALLIKAGGLLTVQQRLGLLVRIDWWMRRDSAASVKVSNLQIVPPDEVRRLCFALSARLRTTHEQSASAHMKWPACFLMECLCASRRKGVRGSAWLLQSMVAIRMGCLGQQDSPDPLHHHAPPCRAWRLRTSC